MTFITWRKRHTYPHTNLGRHLNVYHGVNTQGGGISVSLIQAGVKPHLRVAVSLFLYLLAVQPYSVDFINFERQRYSPTLQDRLVQACLSPALQPLFVPTGWLHFFSWIPSPYLFPPWGTYTIRSCKKNNEQAKKE